MRDAEKELRDALAGYTPGDAVELNAVIAAGTTAFMFLPDLLAELDRLRESNDRLTESRKVLSAGIKRFRVLLRRCLFNQLSPDLKDEIRQALGEGGQP